MNENSRTQDIIWKFAPGGRAMATRGPSPRVELSPEAQKYLHILGPTPKRCLETLADLGLSDCEIGRYFRMPSALVTDLREIWKIDGAA